MASPTDKPIELAKSHPTKIYQTTYKKGQMLGTFHFEFDGELPGAMTKAKKFLDLRNLRHVHTIPWLLNLDEDKFEEENIFSTK